MALRQIVFNRSEWAYRERLGLGPDDHHLVADVEPRAARAPRALGSGPFVSAWRNYLKTLLKPTCFYAFEAKPDILFYVMENKTLAGREDRCEEGHQEAPGRKVTLCFFERAAELPGHVRRADRGSSAMTPTLLTLAEVLHTVWLGASPSTQRRRQQSRRSSQRHSTTRCLSFVSRAKRQRVLRGTSSSWEMGPTQRTPTSATARGSPRRCPSRSAFRGMVP